jgi:hypothetical protein
MAGSVTSRLNAFGIRLLASPRINIRSCTKCCREIAKDQPQAVVILLFLLSCLTPGVAAAGPATVAAKTSDVATPYIVDPAAAPEAVAKLQALSGDMPTGIKPEPSRLRVWIATHLHTLDRLLASSGLDLDDLAAQAEPLDQPFSDGVGGPLLPAAGAGVVEQAAASRGDMLDLDRVRRVQAVLRAVPFSPPMSEYKLNSGFGYRKDPLNRRRALHTGLDFGGPRNAPVLATAPGEVIEASRAGAYGIMVVVDHGMGLQTRYAHLSKAMVRVGDKVTIHQQIGVMGRTGRATGPHLHYEIRLDGRPLNPAAFLDAGGQLVQLAGG